MSRLTEYEENARITPLLITEMFKHRADKLEKRLRYPLEARTHEFFGPGRCVASRMLEGLLELKPTIWRLKNITKHQINTFTQVP